MRNEHGRVQSVVALAAAAALSVAGCAGHWQQIGVPTAPQETPAGKKAREAKPLQPGTEVRLVLRDGTVVEGEFSALANLPYPKYVEEYEAARSRLEATRPVPRLGPGARLSLADGTTRACELVGFTLPGVVIVAEGEKYRSTVPLAQVAELRDGAGQAVPGAVVADLVARAELPSLQAIALKPRKKHAEPPMFPTNMVVQASEKTQGSGAVQVVGVTLLVAGVLVVAAGTSDSGGSSSAGTASSCPFVWGFDGSDWALEAEPLAGSFMELAQRRDLVRLEHARAVDGVYRLRVTNELQEVEHLDQLGLSWVEHAAGARVVPDVYGRLYEVAAERAPVSARDQLGANVLRRVSTADADAWQGNPFLPAQLGPGPARDHVELEFERPEGARHAVLVARVQSTAFAAEVLHSLLSLRGEDLEAWYARVGSDARTLGHLDRLSGESVPSVWQWDGTDWRLAGYLAGLPTRTFATQAVGLDLGRVPGQRLRVRIEGIPGTWRLDSVGVDFAGAASPPARELKLTRARTGKGVDVAPLLALADGRRHVMERGEELELEFEGSEPAAGRGRSLILQATGYYRILLEGRGAPREAEFERLLSEPGALGRHAVELARSRAGADRLAQLDARR